MLEANNAEYYSVLNMLRANAAHSLNGSKFTTASQTDFIILGLDEVGYGCLAGDLWVAAIDLFGVSPACSDNNSRVALDSIIHKITDSKQISSKNREFMATVLRDHCPYSLAQASVAEIEALNVLVANKLAMRRAVNGWLTCYAAARTKQNNGEVPKLILLVDGTQNPFANITTQDCIDAGLDSLAEWFPYIYVLCVVEGDARLKSIGAASIVAKVARDAFMDALGRNTQIAAAVDPYAWSSNKGYGTAKHRQAISKYGLTLWHRKSFCRGLLALLPE